jgi:hypothetical protein
VCTENSEANRVRKKHNRAIIAADVRRFCHQIKRTKFSAHTHLAEIDATHRLLATCAVAAEADSKAAARTRAMFRCGILRPVMRSPSARSCRPTEQVHCERAAPDRPRGCTAPLHANDCPLHAAISLALHRPPRGGGLARRSGQRRVGAQGKNALTRAKSSNCCQERGSGRLCDIFVQCRLQIDGINGEHFHVLLARHKDHSRETVIHGK